MTPTFFFSTICTIFFVLNITATALPVNYRNKLSQAAIPTTDFDGVTKLPQVVRYGYEGSGDCGNESTEDREWINSEYEDLDFDPDGPGLKTTGVFNMGEIGTVSNIRDESFRVTEEQYPEGPGRNNEKDAFRHTYFNARLTQELGAENAKDWSDAYEISNPNQIEERIMDLNNNRAGRQIGEDNGDASPAETAQAVKDAIDNGDGNIMTSPPNCGGDADGEGDPHLKGFDGSSFDFHGEAGKNYILFGDGSGDLLVSKMRNAPAKKQKDLFPRTYFDAFGLQFGRKDNCQRGSKVSVSLDLEEGSANNWTQVVRLNGKRITSNYKNGPIQISMKQQMHFVTVTTSSNVYTFHAHLHQQWRHQDVTLTLKGSPGAAVHFRGMLGWTLNRKLGYRFPVDLFQLKGDHKEMSLRRHFEVPSLFPISQGDCYRNNLGQWVESTGLPNMTGRNLLRATAKN